MSQDELQSKFHACARGVIAENAAERALSYISKLETMASIRPLTDLLKG
jgi:hypothetical protein